MARNYEVGDKVKLLVERDNMSPAYYYGYILSYDSTADDGLYKVSIEGIGDIAAKATEEVGA